MEVRDLCGWRALRPLRNAGTAAGDPDREEGPGARDGLQ